MNPLHLYFIVSIAGTPSMTMRWGSDDVASCTPAIAIAEQAADETFADPARLAKLRAAVPGVQRKDITAECKLLERAPALKNPVPAR